MTQPMKDFDQAINEFLQWCVGEIEITETPCTIVLETWGDKIIHADGRTSYYAFTDTH